MLQYQCRFCALTSTSDTNFSTFLNQFLLSLYINFIISIILPVYSSLYSVKNLFEVYEVYVYAFVFINKLFTGFPYYIY